MNRYHIKIGFKHNQVLQSLTEQLNGLKWQYTEHCLDHIKYRVLDIEGLLLFIKDVELNYNQIFEYYEDNDIIEKICYRISYNKFQDIILVISKEKRIITIYINSKEDNHITLHKELYKNG